VEYLLSNGFQKQPSAVFIRSFLAQWALNSSSQKVEQIDTALGILTRYQTSEKMEIDSDDFDFLSTVRALAQRLFEIDTSQAAQVLIDKVFTLDH
jgi:hypothetical protein